MNPTSRINHFIMEIGGVLILLGVILIIVSEMGVYLPNFSDFEHELTESELNFKVRIFGSGFIFLAVGTLIFGLGKIVKKYFKR